MRLGLLGVLTLFVNSALAVPLWGQLQIAIVETANVLDTYNSADPPPPLPIQALVYNYHFYFSRVDWQNANAFRKELDAELGSDDLWALVVPFFSACFTRNNDLMEFITPHLHASVSQIIKADVKEIKDHFARVVFNQNE